MTRHGGSGSGLTHNQGWPGSGAVLAAVPSFEALQWFGPGKMEVLPGTDR